MYMCTILLQVYGKNKEQFGWPEENEDPSACPSSSKVAQVNSFYNFFIKQLPVIGYVNMLNL